MLLYHYATIPFNILQTPRKQKTPTPEEILADEAKATKRFAIGLYMDHISFFLEPAPLHVLGELFAGHPEAIWIPGRVFYEHVIDTTKIGDFMFSVDATPSDLAVLYKFDKDFKNPTKEDFAKYFEDEYKRKWKLGEYGNGNKELEKIALPLVGTTEQAYRDAIPHFTPSNWRHYAAMVPHAKIYPSGGECILKSPARRVKVGRVNIEAHAINKPNSAHW